jgi:hypothetical protein
MTVVATFAASCSSISLNGAPQRSAPLEPPVALTAKSVHAEPSPSAAPPQQAAPLPQADYKDVLALLLNDDSVVPARPPVHPYHTVYNREAVVPAMCYTRTDGKHNPCYVCHQDRVEGRPNAMNDGELQRAYSFSELGATNHWSNLFEDRTQRIAAISDEAIEAWVAEDNYSDLAERLRAIEFKGYIPDLANLHLGAAAFDEEGFARDGSHWVAFNYKPLPSTFWPTNGATDDVMIRLPESFRTTSDGKYSREIYKANLALVEASIKDMASISVKALDEAAVGADLDGDGKLAVIDRITVTADYVGAAKGAFKRKFLYPQHTELLHSVRYVGVDKKGNVSVPPRMKELRYMRKYFLRTEPQLFELYLQERYAKEDGQLPGYVDRGDHGLDNELGWVLQGFIENRKGQLRAANYEENLFCMGCHASVGATIDSTFSFARKIDGADGWGYIDLRGMPDAPSMGESKGEIATYLERAGGGSELRSNPEMAERWFKGGSVDRRKLANKDVYTLIAPSRGRALDLNKAYRTIVEDQDYVLGRDANVVPPVNVYQQVDNEKAPTLPAELTHRWDIRLDWSRTKLGARRPARP